MFSKFLQPMGNLHHLRGSITQLILLLAIISAFCAPYHSHAATAGVADPPDNVNTVDGSTSATAYHIATLGNLVWLHDEAAADRTLNKYYRLTQDVDASDSANWNDDGTTTNRLEGFTPIGNSAHPFGGVLDGNGQKIAKLSIIRPTTNNVGLIGYGQMGSARILNLTLENCTISGAAYVGSIAGNLAAGVVTNCRQNGSVTGTNDTVGGLVGNIPNGKVTNSYASGSVSGRNVVGGLVGDGSQGTMTDCATTGTLTGSNFVGGLVGLGCVISNCQSSAAVAANGPAGGLVGAYGTLTNCSAAGNVTATGSQVGGLIGYGSIVRNSFATGNVTATHGDDVGGLMGEASVNMAVENCYATGAVFGLNNVGGLIGLLAGNVVSCNARGSVTGNDLVGGLVGNVQFTGDITSSYATGSVNAYRRAGGLIGLSLLGGKITDCYAAGNVTVTPDNSNAGVELNAGGLVGNNLAQIQDCYASGQCTVKASPGVTYFSGIYLGGLVGRHYGTSSQALRCYASGPVSLVSSVDGTPYHPANAYVGGLNGNVSDDTIVLNSYWDTQSTGQSTSVGGTGLTTTQMRTLDTLSNWDFASVWGLQGGYPYLRGLPTCTATYRAAAHGTLGLDPGAGLTEFPQVLNPGARTMPVLAAGTPGFPFIRWSDGLTTNPRIDAGLLADTTLTAFFGTSTAARHWPAYE
jgi:hypothetical protein